MFNLIPDWWVQLIPNWVQFITLLLIHQLLLVHQISWNNCIDVDSFLYLSPLSFQFFSLSKKQIFPQFILCPSLFFTWSYKAFDNFFCFTYLLCWSLLSQKCYPGMVQILNKMVHLKYPILEICWCHKHTTQLPPSRLKFDTKLGKVFPNNLAA